MSFLPPSLVYSRKFPTRRNYLKPKEKRTRDDWAIVWRDDTIFFELGELDAERMETFPGTSHSFEIGGSKYTIYAACGHVNRGEDYHQLCRNCQALTRRRLCCINLKDEGGIIHPPNATHTGSTATRTATTASSTDRIRPWYYTTTATRPGSTATHAVTTAL